MNGLSKLVLHFSLVYFCPAPFSAVFFDIVKRSDPAHSVSSFSVDHTSIAYITFGLLTVVGRGMQAVMAKVGGIACSFLLSQPVPPVCLSIDFVPFPWTWASAIKLCIDITHLVLTGALVETFLRE